MNRHQKMGRVGGRTLGLVAALILPGMVLTDLAGAQVLPEGTLSAPGRPPEANRDPGVQPANPAAPVSDVAVARSQVLQWFRGFEFQPGEKHFGRIEPATLASALMAIAQDASLGEVVRARAISAMVYAPKEAVEATLVSLLEQPEADPMLRAKAALVLTDRFGVRHLDLLVSAFVDAHEHPRLRAAIAQGLREVGPEAHAAREQLWRAEKDPNVRYWLSGGKNVRAGRPQ
jgi:hypothetical protein